MKKIYLYLFGAVVNIGLDIWIIQSLNSYTSLIKATFIILSILTLILYVQVIKNSMWYFEAGILGFYILFFIVAPVIQLKIGQLPDLMYIENNLVVKANLINIVFLFIYIIFRMFFEKKIGFRFKEFKISKKTNRRYLILFIISFLITIKYFLGLVLYRKVQSVNSDSSINLIIQNFLLCIPVYFLFNELNKYFNLKIKNKVKMISTVILSLIIVNPLIFSRAIFGSIYLSALGIIIKKMNAAKIYIIIMIAMIFIFPLMANITHSKTGLSNLSNKDFYYNDNMFYDQFKELHFDAWSNLNTDIQMVNNNDFPIGTQFVGSMLFFVPRSLWHNKPLSSGQVTGNYLMKNYNLTFNNLSCPLTSELYISFRWAGIILGAIFMAYIGRKVSVFVQRKNFYRIIAIFISFYNIFLFRGDLMVATAYLSGVLVTVWIAPLLLEKISKTKAEI